MKNLIIIGFIVLALVSCGDGNQTPGNSSDSTSISSDGNSNGESIKPAIPPDGNGDDTTIQSNRMHNTLRDSVVNNNGAVTANKKDTSAGNK